MTTDDEFRAAAKLNAHDKVMAQGGPIHLSMGEMINVGVDVGIDFERLRVCSVLRAHASRALTATTQDALLLAAMQVEEGIQ